MVGLNSNVCILFCMWNYFVAHAPHVCLLLLVVVHVFHKLPCFRVVASEFFKLALNPHNKVGVHG